MSVGPLKYAVTFAHPSGIPQTFTRTASSEELAISDAADGYLRTLKVKPGDPIDVEVLPT